MTAFSPNYDGGSPESPRITIRHIAELLGFSCATVSRALRQDLRISPGTRNQIQKAAQELGYRPEPTARALSHYRQPRTAPSIHSAMAWVHQRSPGKFRPCPESDFYWNGALDAARNAGYRLESFEVGPELSLKRLESILLARNTRGILIPPHPPGTDWQGFDWKKFSAIRFGFSIPSLNLTVVSPDEAGNALLAAKKMQALGYRRIGFICSEGRSWAAAGFLAAQRHIHGNQQPPILRFETTQERISEKALFRWIQKYKLDAILGATSSLKHDLSACGLRLGETLGFAALNVTAPGEEAGIFSQPEAIGRIAVKILISELKLNERGGPATCHTTMIPGTWVDGATLPGRAEAPR